MSAHGTYSRYNHGRCRCVDCKTANADYHGNLRSKLRLRPLADVPHGTTGGYGNWSCRCDDCCAVHRVAMAAAYARRKAARHVTVPAEGLPPFGGVGVRTERHPLP